MLISVSNLTVSYEKKTAVDNISFDVPAGTSLGILGSNGAGKSSTLKVLSGVIVPSKGEVLIDGNSMGDFNESNVAKMITGYCPDVGGIIPQATLREHIDLTLSLHRKLDMWPAALRIVAQYGLTNELDTVVAGYSHGMSRRASVILATLSSSKLLILDEPFDGVDPKGVESVKHTIREAKNAGLSVIVSTHLQSILAEATDNIMVMTQGHIVTTQPSSKFLGSKGVKYYSNIIKKHDRDVKND